MALTKLDEKGRILPPKEIREKLNIKLGEGFLVADVGRDAIVLKRVDVRKMLEDLIERVKSVDLEKLEEEIEREGNRVARKRFLIDTNVFIAAVKKGWTKTTDL